MQGFQAKTVAAVRSQRVVCVVKVSELRAKAFQIGFDKDGSLFVNFPYFQHRTGILSSSEIPATGERKADVNIEHGGKSHRTASSIHPENSPRSIIAIPSRLCISVNSWDSTILIQMFCIGRERRTRSRGVEPAGSCPTLVNNILSAASFY
jgi:hypothetical protein